MRKLFVVICAAGLLLAGCSTLAPPPTTSEVASDVPVSRVQEITKRVCSFVPTAKTVAGIFATFVGGTAYTDTAGKIADSICNAIINNPMTEGPFGGRTIPRVNGVAVEGRFVRRR